MKRVLAGLFCCGMAWGQGGLQTTDAFAGKKKLLAIGDTRTGFQHDSVSHALAVIERLGWESGAYVTFIKTDSQLLTKQPILIHDDHGKPSAPRRTNAKNLDYFDAIFFIGIYSNMRKLIVLLKHHASVIPHFQNLQSLQTLQRL